MENQKARVLASREDNQDRETARVNAPALASNLDSYLRRGLCRGWLNPLIKTVAALPGQQIDIAADVTIDGYDNVILDLSRDGARVLYRERMPVPVSMWRPWQSLTGEGGSARAHFFDNPVVDFAGLKAAPLICYERLLIWPVLQSALYEPEVIVASGNGWWTDGTDVIAIQQANVTAWAIIFGFPLIVSFNR